MSASLFNRLMLYAILAVFVVFLVVAAFGTVMRAQGEPLPVALLNVATPMIEELVQAGATSTPAGGANRPTPAITRRPTRTPSVTPTPTPSLTPRPTRTPRATATPIATDTPPVPPEPTDTPTPRPSPTSGLPASPVATAHYWFRRPIAPPGDDTVAYFYPYGSTGEGTLPIHHGVEFVNPQGTQVIAAGDGVVVFAGSDDATAVGPRPQFYGNVVVIRHDQQWLGKDVYTLYGHLAAIQVAEGQAVKAGDPIGLVGMTGIAMGPHLHFEVRVGENSYAATRNPELWIQPHPEHGTIAGRVLDAAGNPVPLAFVTVQRPNDAIWRSASSYPATEVNGDEELGENLVLGNMPVGRWLVAARVGDEVVVDEVTVRPGETTWALLQPKS